MTNNFSEDFFQRLCDERNEPTIIVKANNPQFEVVSCNPQFYNVSCIRSKNIVGLSMSEIHVWNSTNEEGALQIHDALNEVISTKQTVRLPMVRYDLPPSDNGVNLAPTWWQTTYQPLYGADERVEFILCTVIQLFLDNKIETDTSGGTLILQDKLA